MKTLKPQKKPKEVGVIEKLNIQLLADRHADYDKYVADLEARKNKFVAEARDYIPGGFLQSGSWINNPAKGEAEWKLSPWSKLRPYEEWIKNNNDKLSSVGQQRVIDKINEIIEAISPPLTNKPKRK